MTEAVTGSKFILAHLNGEKVAKQYVSLDLFIPDICLRFCVNKNVFIYQGAGVWSFS